MVYGIETALAWGASTSDILKLLGEDMEGDDPP